jgi:Tol biopolymer transport system component/DNA-binding winged helix-turn-helix (wHTH) protein
MFGQPVRFYEFGPFSIDLSSRVVLRDAKALPLEPKLFDTLLVLVENHGKVVSKEELMKAVWGPDTFVEEGSLTRNISLLRKTIAEGLGDTQCIATFPKRGYQFVAPVRGVTEGSPAEPAAEPHALSGAPAVAETKTWHGHVGRAHGQDARATAGGTPAPQINPVAALAAGVAVLALVLGYWFVRPLPVPVVSGHQLLTHDGREKLGPLLTDGAQLYFEEKVDGKWSLASVPTVGGNLNTSSLPSPDVRISDITPGGRDLIGWEAVPGELAGRLLIWPDADGPPVTLTAVQGCWPTWSPDGARIAFSDGVHSVFVAGRQDENPLKVVSVEGCPQGLRWSPGGESLCFMQVDPKSEAVSVWEVPATGGHPHSLLLGGKNLDSVPTWTPAGTYSLFLWGSKDAPDIWAQRENCNPVRWRCREPMRIAAGLGGYMDPLPSRDGKRLFVMGGQYKKDLVRYDMKSGTFTPYLPDLQAADPELSPDGKWLVYARLPERTLWRSRLDGSNSTRLTASGAEVYSPHWSPDGKQITYMAVSSEKQYKAWVVPAEGGPPEELLPGAGEEGIPTWSRDGNFVVFGDTLHVGHASAMTIHVLDLRSRQVSNLLGSAGLWTPRWSPNGRYIAALVLADEAKGGLAICPAVLLYDTKARRWENLAKAENIRNLAWSRDSRYVYFHTGASDFGLYRVDIASKKVERLASLKGFAEESDDWIGVTRDGSPLVIGDTRIDEVYALDVQWP